MSQEMDLLEAIAAHDRPNFDRLVKNVQGGKQATEVAVQMLHCGWTPSAVSDFLKQNNDKCVVLAAYQTVVLCGQTDYILVVNEALQSLSFNKEERETLFNPLLEAVLGTASASFVKKIMEIGLPTNQTPRMCEILKGRGL